MAGYFLQCTVVLTPVMCLLAQAAAPSVESLAGGSGWVGAGLLGAVLSWLLLWHLPDKDKQLKAVMDAKDAQIEALLTRYLQTEKEQRLAFQASLETVVNSHTTQLKGLNDMIGADFKALRTAIEGFIEAN